MSRSIFPALRHRYGSPRQPLTRIRSAGLAGAAGLRPLPPADQFREPIGLTVTVIGGGFAGLMAACFLRAAGFGVTVLEARPDVGGRVASYTDVSAGRVIEAGAELIGANHPMWLSLATGLGLGLSVLTSEDEFTAASLDMPLYLRGRKLLPGEAEDLYRDMTAVLERISDDASSIEDPYRPWTSGHAPEWDATTVTQRLIAFGVDPASLLWDLLAADLGNNQALSIDQQSYLGLTAAVRGGQLDGDPMAFWTQSEIFRCEAGNQQLARSLRDLLLDVSPGSVLTRTPAASVSIQSDHVTVTAGRQVFESDYAVLAVPQPAWQWMTISPPVPAAYHISTGPAVKYLSPVTGRFWLRGRQAPSGLSGALGMTWEGTDNQMVVGGQGVELSVFAGGPWARAALGAPDRQKYFSAGLTNMYPDYPFHASGPGVFVGWPDEHWTMCGYSCPTVGQVTTAARRLDSMYAGRLAFAGEHTVMAMFGYMEGALQSGFLAAGRILAAAGLSA